MLEDPDNIIKVLYSILNIAKKKKNFPLRHLATATKHYFIHMEERQASVGKYQMLRMSKVVFAIGIGVLAIAFSSTCQRLGSKARA